MKGCTVGLAFIKRQKAIRNWPINTRNRFEKGKFRDTLLLLLVNEGKTKNLPNLRLEAFSWLPEILLRSTI